MKMNYQKLFKIAVAILLTAIICISFISCSNQKPAPIEPDVYNESDAQIIFFETNDDADCALISANGVYIMIDTGEKKDAKNIVKILNEKGISRLDYLIFSHFDKDHIGGAFKMLDEISVDKVFHPSYIKDSEEAEKLMNLLKEKEIDVSAVSKKDSIELDEIALQFIPAEKEIYLEKESNNSSLVVKANIYGVTALFTGDCQDERVEELLNSNNDFSADILKLMYHGREVNNEKEFVNKISPSYTVVTGKNGKKTKGNVEKLNLGEVYYNQNGTIVFEIENSKITPIQENKH